MDDDQTPEENTEEEVKVIEENGGQIVINMEGMIKNLITAIEKLQTETKKHKEMLDDIFSNSPTFKEHQEKAKEASKVLAATKGEILKQTQAADLSKKIKDFRSEFKEMQASLSDYLTEYQRLSGVNEVEGEDGDVREIIFSAKLIKKYTKQN